MHAAYPRYLPSRSAAHTSTAPSPSFHNFSVVQELVMLRWHSEFKMIYQELRKLVITHEIIIKDE